ncbi:6-bladed beta-propeller [Puteibacter caeruleilacunae]|nr:6-bladed beta-propeller [Puteibacter caeruleilacunae]
MKLLSLIFSISLLSACTQTDEKKMNQHVKRIDLTEAKLLMDDFRLSEIAQSIRYVKLESSEKCRIRSINNVKTTLDFIFIQDQQESLFQFDADGGFVRKIGSKGKGPGEFLHLTDFTIDEASKKVLIYDNFGRSVKEYSYDGKFEKETAIDFYPISFEMSASRNLFFNNVSPFPKKIIPYGVTVCNQQLQKVNKLLNKEWERAFADEMVPSSLCNLQRFGERMTFWEYNHDTIWHLSDKSAVAEYFLDFSKYRIPFELRSSKKDINYAQYGFIENIIETQRYVFIDACLKRQKKRYLLCKENNEVIDVFRDRSKVFFMNIELENDVDGALSFWPDRRGFVNDSILCKSFFPFELKRNMERNNSLLSEVDCIDNEVASLLKKTSVTDNPVLMFVKLK